VPPIKDLPVAELSPYLAQHRDNPVEWYPWGEEALERAEALGRPLFVSIGYSSCHWCHVMAHESFEDEATADYLNAHFVPVKVDREERPDVDAIYMEAVQALQDGGGGWPLSVFATPAGRPFFGGTYFPNTARHGSPSFIEVLTAVQEAWATRRGELEQQAAGLTAAVAARIAPPGGSAAPSSRALLEGAVERARLIYDADFGGFGRAPKFPQAPILELLLRAHLAGAPGTLEIVTTTLKAMAAGGIYDHLAGGFARYSTDRAWRVPHFEKMLYDQAMLARIYLHAFEVTGDLEFRQVLEETLDYVLRELRDPNGGLWSAEDADAGGIEGRYSTWTPEELIEVLGATDGALAARWYAVSPGGNFEGRSIPHRRPGEALTRPGEIEAIRVRLLAARLRRVRPGVDDKILTEWNAMFASVLAEAGAALGRPDWITAAEEIAEFLLSSLRRDDGRWLRTWRGGRAANLAVAADHAWLVDCFTRLGEATGAARWTAHARAVAGELIARFSAEDGGWFTTGSDADELIVRPRDLYDGVTPAAGSVAAGALTRLAALLGDEAFAERARASVTAAGEALALGPLGFPQLVIAACLIETGPVEVVIGCSADRALVSAVQRRYLPEIVLAWGEPTGSPLWEGRSSSEDDRGYVCRAGTCLAPVTDEHALAASIDAARLAAAVRFDDPVNGRIEEGVS